MAKFMAGARRRYAMRMPVKLENNAQSRMEGLLIELSQECARISQLQRGACAEGDIIVLETPGGMKREGIVRFFASSGIAGIRFADALRARELAELLDSRTADAA